VGPREAPELSDWADDAPIIVWNHRWEFDKDPGAFFSALYELEARDVEFRVALLGENFQAVPKQFQEARERLGTKILRYGYEDSQDAYRTWLRRGRLVVSTAIQENFGISVVEACRFGCIPLLPARLSYPEILPPRFHDRCIYRSHEELIDKLARALTNPCYIDRSDLMRGMCRYAWESVVADYDDEIDRVARMRRRRPADNP
jgi:glycosyltransferase involved in cell wall biosynthesis